MPGGVSIEVAGLDKLVKKLGAIPKNVEQEIDGVLGKAAVQFEQRAVSAAPVDEGRLKNGIKAEPVKPMEWKVVSMAEYSAYVEFGTKSRVQVPAGLEAYAAQFRGKGGGDVKKRVFAWCKRKGIEPALWWPIFLKLMRIGADPHPFFFKQMPEAQQQINRELAPAINRALKQA